MSAEAAVDVVGVAKRFTVPTDVPRSLKEKILRTFRGGHEKHTYQALQDLSFSVSRGQTFGVIGSNGSGKSTLFKLLCGVLVPDVGTIRVDGRIAAIVELTAGFHLELTGRENIYLNGAIYGMSHEEVDAKFAAIESFAGIREFMDARIRTYSSGMLARLAFALAINMDADVLMFDEVLAVGDLEFRDRCMMKINELRDLGKTVLYVSHALEQVRSLCDRVMWLERGKLRMVGNADEVIAAYEAHCRGK